MRKSWEIEKEIEEIEAKIQRFKQQIRSSKTRLIQLRNTKYRVLENEELERDGVEIAVVKIEGGPGDWTAITDEDLKFGGMKRPKMGKQKITRRFYELMVECKKEV